MKIVRYIVLIALLVSGCAKQHPEKENNVFTLDTKAVSALETASTFRIMMYSELDRGFQQSGTYYSKDGVEELVACSLDDNGVFQNEDAGKGINGVSGKVNLVLVSPGKYCYEDGSFDFTPDGTETFYVNAPELRTVGGYGKVRLQKPLYDPRSKISFEFYRKPGVADFTVKDDVVNIVGVSAENETVRIYPALRQVKMKSVDQTRQLSLNRVGEPVQVAEVNDYYQVYSVDQSLTIASGIYAPKAEAVDYLEIPIATNVMDGSYIYMSCDIIQEGRTISLRLPLNDKEIEMMPQYQYVYKVLVESDYITVNLDVYDGTDVGWEDGGDSSSEIGTLSSTLQIGQWALDGWQSDGDINFEIG